MHVRTEYPPTELEMYIVKASGRKANFSEESLLGSNNTHRFENPEYPHNMEVMLSESPQTIQGVLLVMFVTFGFIFNSFMIISIVPNRRLRTVRNILLAHLGCTGILLTFMINLVTAVVSFTGRWFGGLTLCQLFGFILTTLTLVTSWTITALSWDKYQTIASPLHHSFTAKAIRMFVGFSVVWALAFVMALPPLIGASKFVFHPDKGICFICTKSLSGKIYVMAYLLAAVYMPLTIMLFCYTHIYKIARSQSSRIAATMIQMTCVIQATIAPNATTNTSVKSTKAMCTIFQLVGTFVIVYIPMSVILLTDIFVSNGFQTNSVLSTSVTLIFLSSPVVHSSVYGLRNKTLRLSFKRYLRRKFRYYCYKDKRRNSVKSFKSFRSSSFLGGRRHNHQNGTTSVGLRRTQSFPARGYRGSVRYLQTLPEVNGDALSVQNRDLIARPRSFNALTPEPISEKTEPLVSDNSESAICINEVNVPDDIPPIDNDDIQF